MTAGAGGDSDQAIRTFVDGFMREDVVDDVVQHDAAVRVHRLVHVFTRPQRSDDNRYFIADTEFQIVSQPVVGLVNDQVHGKGSCRLRRVGSVMLR